jgi:hypothetical protein
MSFDIYFYGVCVRTGIEKVPKSAFRNALKPGCFCISMISNVREYSTFVNPLFQIADSGRSEVDMRKDQVFDHTVRERLDYPDDEQRVGNYHPISPRN